MYVPTCSCSCAKNQKVCTYHEEHAEVGQFSEEFFHTDRVGVKGKITAYTFIQLLHVLVHGGQFFILLPGTLAEAVRRRESRKKGERHVSNIHKAYSKSYCNNLQYNLTSHKHVDRVQKAHLCQGQQNKILDKEGSETI